MPLSPFASAPVSSAGRNGRTPVAPETPAPWPMSRGRLIERAVRCGGVTLDDDLNRGRGGPRGGETRRMTGGRSTSRDIERYAGLFASRTRGMKSSAMRDLMAVIARPEVISLAGGLPDTGAFPSETFAAITERIARESSAAALQYGPTEGLPRARECVAEVMEAEGVICDPEDMIVTTGGQQVIDLVTRALIDPGDVIVAEAPTYPGAVPSFSSFQADVVQIEM